MLGRDPSDFERDFVQRGSGFEIDLPKGLAATHGHDANAGPGAVRQRKPRGEAKPPISP